MSVRKIPIKITGWTRSIRNSNEKRVLKSLKKNIPNHKNIPWTEEIFLDLYISILNSLPARYKQKNSIVLSGRLEEETLQDCVTQKLKELSEKFNANNPVESNRKNSS